MCDFVIKLISRLICDQIQLSVFTPRKMPFYPLGGNYPQVGKPWLTCTVLTLITLVPACVDTTVSTNVSFGTPLYRYKCFNDLVTNLKSLPSRPGKITGEQYFQCGRTQAVTNHVEGEAEEARCRE
ncbi:unnamed protein product, partial [Dicrocoelium dendriticum]